MGVQPILNPLKTVTSFGAAARSMIDDRRQLLHIIPWCRSLAIRLFESEVGLPEQALPGFTFDAISWLEPRLNKNTSVFEWGSGSSTYYFSERCKGITSVEHDAVWANLLRRNLPDNCKLLLELPVTASQINAGSARNEYRHKDFGKYVRSIELQDEDFDVIVIDGRARVSCGKRALAHLAPGGCIVLDNSERTRYTLLSAVFSGLQRHDFYGLGPRSAAPWQTTIWTR